MTTRHRALLLFVIAYAVPVTFLITLITELGRAFRYALLDAKIEIESFRKEWERR